MIKNLKITKINILLLIICLFFLLNKTNFIKDFYRVIKFDEHSRVVANYGYCGGESIGYLKYLKKKYAFKSNPKIINYIHSPSSLWSIYDTNYSNLESNFEILINYPGKKIDIDLPLINNNFFELKKNTYSLGRISKEKIELSLDDKTINKLKIEFYNYASSDNLEKFYTLEIAKSSSENQFNLDNINNELNIGKKNIFLKIISKKGIYLNENLKLIFQNKYQLDKLKILDNYKNCYLIKND
tara:strand:+ start:1141 stop:1866 length:726 start_codon:yes stop_codon:yes gene_type:complete